MILDKIETLRKEPKAVRNRYAFGTALSVTVLIAVVWAISLPSRLTLQNVASGAPDPNTPSLQNQLSDFRSFMGESLADFKLQAELIETTAEGELATTTATTSVTIPATLPSFVPLIATSSTFSATGSIR